MRQDKYKELGIDRAMLDRLTEAYLERVRADESYGAEDLRKAYESGHEAAGGENAGDGQPYADGITAAGAVHWWDVASAYRTGYLHGAAGGKYGH